MPKYSVSMVFHYIIETDDIEKVLNEFEFPTFPYPGDEEKISFQVNSNDYYKISEKEAEIYA